MSEAGDQELIVVRAEGSSLRLKQGPRRKGVVNREEGGYVRFLKGLLNQGSGFYSEAVFHTIATLIGAVCKVCARGHY